MCGDFELASHSFAEIQSGFTVWRAIRLPTTWLTAHNHLAVLPNQAGIEFFQISAIFVAGKDSHPITVDELPRPLSDFEF